MNKDEADKRESEGKPIESADELIFALMKLQRERTVDRSKEWYRLNRVMRLVMSERDGGNA